MSPRRHYIRQGVKQIFLTERKRVVSWRVGICNESTSRESEYGNGYVVSVEDRAIEICKRKTILKNTRLFIYLFFSFVFIWKYD